MIPEGLTIEKLKLILTPLEWYEKAELVVLYISLRQNEEDNFSPYKASKELDLSESMIYESILLMKYMSDDMRNLKYKDAVAEALRKKRNGE